MKLIRRQAVAQAYGKVSLQLRIDAGDARQDTDGCQFPVFPVQSIPLKYVSEQMRFQELVNASVLRASLCPLPRQYRAKIR